MNTPQPKGRRFARLTRPLTLAITAMILGVGLITAGVATAPPAQAIDLIPGCNADTSFPQPVKPATNQEATYTTATQSVDGMDEPYVIVIPDESEQTPVAQYGGAGLRWYPFGLNCFGAATTTALLNVANMVFEVFALWPLRILGVLMNFAFSTAITNWLLDLTSGVADALDANIVTKYLPLVIMLVVLGAAWKVARGRAQQAVSTAVWVVICTAGMSALFTPWGVEQIQKLNDHTATITQCATFGTAGAGCADSSAAGYAEAMVESLAVGVWTQGALGDLGRETPDSWTWTLTGNEGDLKVSDGGKKIHIPTSVIPSRLSGQPTYGEILRWTQTYTTAEVVAMQENPDLQCRSNPRGSPQMDQITDIEDAKDLFNGSELCTYKWLIRAALVDRILSDHQDELAGFQGVTMQGFTAAVGAVGLLPLALGIGVMGLMVLLYQLELVALFTVGPIVGLVAVKEPRIARKWAEFLTASLVKRVAVGLVFGFTLWLASEVNTHFMGAITVRGGITAFPPYLIPVATSALTIAVMVVGFMLLKKLQSLLLDATPGDLPQQGVMHSTGDKIKEGVKRTGGIALSAASGALAAGSGLALRGAGKAALSSAVRKQSLAGAVMTGRRAGGGVAAQAEAARQAQARQEEQGAKEHSAAQQQHATAEGRATQAWTQFARKLRPEEFQKTAEALTKEQKALEELRDKLASHNAGRDALIEVAARDMDLPYEDAMTVATRDWEATQQQLKVAIDWSQMNVTKFADQKADLNARWQERVEAVATALDNGESAESIADREAFNDATENALHQFVRQSAEAARLGAQLQDGYWD